MGEHGESDLILATEHTHLSFSAHSDIGLVRSVNEDSFLAGSPVFLVADGMGGHARGEVASQTVVRVFEEHIERDVPSTPERILDAIHSSNDAVHDLSSADDFGSAVAGTTLAGVAIVDAGEGTGLCWMAFNIGDSRVYTWDGHVLRQLSVDHSAVQAMIDAGLLRPEDAESWPERNVITRAIGLSDHADADVWLIPIDGRQTFLICSDGVSNELSLERMTRILAAHETGKTAAQNGGGVTVAEALVAAALDHRGRDNLTAIVVGSHSRPIEVLA
ncbi:protein phosphatase 2C domain-containing protein [Leifsonia kafniensis]|uniref:Protein phosphatase 2C domain-containing protein n=1 Tax=Leifsonia kafniensis TaxID=475957 RepID=A0ABP7K922_9MICO